MEGTLVNVNIQSIVVVRSASADTHGHGVISRPSENHGVVDTDQRVGPNCTGVGERIRESARTISQEGVEGSRNSASVVAATAGAVSGVFASIVLNESPRPGGSVVLASGA